VVAEFADGEAGDGDEGFGGGFGAAGVEDEAGDLVGFVGDDGFVVEVSKG